MSTYPHHKHENDQVSPSPRVAIVDVLDQIEEKIPVAPIGQRMHPEQKKIYQSMTPAQKLDVSMKLYQSAKALKAAIIKEQHPTWNEEKIKKKVNEIFLYAGT